VTKTCPDCRGPLFAELHGGVQLDLCVCGGAWFDPGELKRWSPRAAARLRELAGAPAATAPPCPGCAAAGGSLRPRQAAGASVGVCARCTGVWLPRKSFAALAPGASRDASSDAAGWGGFGFDAALHALFGWLT
jgi:Zn-finger nucleic acid-binding protein